jgi:hypothetical protein
MTSRAHGAGALLFAIISLGGLVLLAQEPIARLQQMAGAWTVQQHMWPAAGAKALTLPPAVARRRVIGNAFLQEVMESAPGGGDDRFTRIAYLNYNAVNQQFEYFSIDTRAPQMMNERSHGGASSGRDADQRGITLFGESFVAPQWGDAKNAAFRYRLTVGDVEHDVQRVRLYLTPQTGEGGGEFLAFEYVYSRQR